LRREHEQDGYDVRLEWGREGVVALGTYCAVVVIIDVLSFCTAVDVAVGRGAVVLPLPWGDERGADVARRTGATLAGARSAGGLSLSPASLRNVPARTRRVSAQCGGDSPHRALAGPWRPDRVGACR
jgi:2-phosphosulfolactate phosphatase